MAVKLASLKTGENIISDIKEGYYQDKLVCYILENPCKVIINGSYKIIDEDQDQNKYSISLTRWPTLSKDTTVEIVPELIVTMVNPIDNLTELYETQILRINKNEINQIAVLNEQSDSNQSN